MERIMVSAGRKKLFYKLVFRTGRTGTILLLILCCPIFLFAQQIIKGKVVNTSTGTALANCNVFINNTTRGTVTDNAGYFELNNVPGGKYELIISSVGYETRAIPFIAAELPLDLLIKLSIRIRELENVTVEPFEEGSWQQWGAIFTESFIGRTENAAHCKILNQDSIRFRYYKKSNRLIAFSDIPLIIENKSLGYIISYQLEEFELNYRQRSIFFLGYPLVQEIEHDRRALQEKWNRKRQKAYQGSVFHFMRSLYDNRLKEEGFEVRRMMKLPNTEKLRVKAIYKDVKISKKYVINGKTSIEYVNEPANLPKDSINYYRKVLQQPDINEEYGKDILTADSLIEKSEARGKIIFFTDYIFVTYKYETEDPEFIRSQMLTRRPSYQRSTVMLLNGNAIVVEAGGHHYDPRDFFTSGYWGWSEKMADYLPLDYEVRKE